MRGSHFKATFEIHILLLEMDIWFACTSISTGPSGAPLTLRAICNCNLHKDTEAVAFGTAETVWTIEVAEVWIPKRLQEIINRKSFSAFNYYRGYRLMLSLSASNCDIPFFIFIPEKTFKTIVAL